MRKILQYGFDSAAVRYKLSKYISVLMITVGITIATIASAKDVVCLLVTV